MFWSVLGMCFNLYIDNLWNSVKGDHCAQFALSTGFVTRDETIRSSHDTIHIDTKGADMIIYDTIRVVVKIQLFTIFTFFYLLSPKINTTGELFFSQFYKHISNTVHIKLIKQIFWLVLEKTI